MRKADGLKTSIIPHRRDCQFDTVVRFFPIGSSPVRPIHRPNCTKLNKPLKRHIKNMTMQTYS